MNRESLAHLKELLVSQRVLSLSVLIDGAPYIGLLPFALTPDFTSALVHASQLARHTRGLRPGAPFATLVHAPDDPDSDPLQVARAIFTGEVRVVAKESSAYSRLSGIYLQRFPGSEVTFNLGDFTLFELPFREGRFVEGFAAAYNITAEDMHQLAK